MCLTRGDFGRESIELKINEGPGSPKKNVWRLVLKHDSPDNRASRSVLHRTV